MSWVIREIATQRVICETFDPRKVQHLNRTRYEAVPVREYLAQLNAKIKQEQQQ